MIKPDSKKVILASLGDMDREQADKVLEYIQSLLLSPRERVDYKRFRESAIEQIKRALKEG